MRFLLLEVEGEVNLGYIYDYIIGDEGFTAGEARLVCSHAAAMAANADQLD
jgi:hypothetical protein